MNNEITNAEDREALVEAAGDAIERHWPGALDECRGDTEPECESGDDCVRDVVASVLADAHVGHRAYHDHGGTAVCAGCGSDTPWPYDARTVLGAVAAGADPWEIIRRQERYIEGLENGLGAKVRDVTYRLVESGLSWNEASSRVDALAAAMPTTTTEWGVREPNSARTTAVPSREEAEEWMGDEDAWNPSEPRILVAREVTEWREVTS